MKKKIYLGIGTMAALTAPVAAIVACNEKDDKTTLIQTVNGNKEPVITYEVTGSEVNSKFFFELKDVNLRNQLDRSQSDFIAKKIKSYFDAKKETEEVKSKKHNVEVVIEDMTNINKTMQFKFDISALELSKTDELIKKLSTLIGIIENNASHEGHDHEGHGHEEQTHKEEIHKEHNHKEHNHDEHGHEEHNHDGHGHEEHSHEGHYHDEHDHEE